MAYKIFKGSKHLLDKLENMSGADFDKAEREARIAGDNTADLMLSRNFYATLAAKAYGVPMPEIKLLPMKEYAVITGVVGSFFRDAEDVEESPKE